MLRRAWSSRDKSVWSQNPRRCRRARAAAGVRGLIPAVPHPFRGTAQASQVAAYPGALRRRRGTRRAVCSDQSRWARHCHSFRAELAWEEPAAHQDRPLWKLRCGNHSARNGATSCVHPLASRGHGLCPWRRAGWEKRDD